MRWSMGTVYGRNTIDGRERWRSTIRCSIWRLEKHRTGHIEKCMDTLRVHRRVWIKVCEGRSGRGFISARRRSIRGWRLNSRKGVDIWSVRIQRRIRVRRDRLRSYTIMTNRIVLSSMVDGRKTVKKIVHTRLDIRTLRFIQGQRQRWGGRSSSPSYRCRVHEAPLEPLLIFLRTYTM